MKRLSKIVVFVIALSMLLSVFTSCSTKKKETAVTSIKDANTAAATSSADINNFKKVFENVLSQAHLGDYDSVIADIMLQKDDNGTCLKWTSGASDKCFSDSKLIIYHHFNDSGLQKNYLAAVQYFNSLSCKVKIEAREGTKGYNSIYNYISDDPKNGIVIKDGKLASDAGGTTHWSLLSYQNAFSHTCIEIHNEKIGNSSDGKKQYVILHELGHALGLKHPDGSSIQYSGNFQKESIMAPEVPETVELLKTGTYKDQAAIYTIDLVALRELYGS